MALKLLQITAPVSAESLLSKMARDHDAVSFEIAADLNDDHRLYFLLAKPTGRQELIDSLHNMLQTSSRARVVICPVDATLPAPKTKSPSYTREELYQQLMLGSEVNWTYLILGALSTFVALVGLLQDNVAVVIGAMVIAPLLGPNLTFALGTALNDQSMIKRAVKAALYGLFIAISISSLTGWLWGDIPASDELLDRTVVGFDSVALAVAAGIAGVLSLTTGLSMTLVGVMVAVALAPPAATFGFMLGAGDLKLAFGAGLLLSVNIVCVNLSGLAVFLAKGFTARDVYTRRMGTKYIVIGLVGWTAALLVLMWVIGRGYNGL